MLDDSHLPTRLLTLGVALFAIGLGCHFWADRVYRAAGLAIGAVQLCRYLVERRIESDLPDKMEKRRRWIKGCDHVTAVLLVMAAIHAIVTAQV